MAAYKGAEFAPEVKCDDAMVRTSHVPLLQFAVDQLVSGAVLGFEREQVVRGERGLYCGRWRRSKGHGHGAVLLTS